MNDSHEALALLSSTRTILLTQKEKNWIRGIDAAIEQLEMSESEEGFQKARITYNAMTAGGRGFSEYYVQNGDGTPNAKFNSELDSLRSSLWRLFNPS